MKVLVIGGGGREHALAWCLSRSPLLRELWVAPGNPGMARIARLVSIQPDDIDGLTALAEAERFDLTVVGPEVPLAAGLVDRLQERGLLAFGPTRMAAELEASKAFAKELMVRYGIPTAGFKAFNTQESALAFLDSATFPLVVKADGLCAGKGVVIAGDRREARAAVMSMMTVPVPGAGGARVVIEEYLEGEEASFLALADGTRLVPLASSQDHKTVYDGDVGPNTGGMGAISPTPVMTPEVIEAVMTGIMMPTLRAMAAEGREFRGVLYAGLMIKNGVARVLEFNVRFGDPEAQAILVRLGEDLLPLLLDAARGRLFRSSLLWRNEVSTAVVLTARGYPGEFRKGMSITGLEAAEKLDAVTVFHGGTSLMDGQLVTAGGRVLTVAALGMNQATSRTLAYEAVHRISWEEIHYRTDIGLKAAKHSSER